MLIKEVCASGTIETQGIISKMAFKRKKFQELKQNWIERREAKRIHWELCKKHTLERKE